MTTFAAKPMMACGCASISTHSNPHDGLEAGHPSCVIHGCCAIIQTPDLTGRTARCCDKSEPQPSSTGLAFFEFRGEGSPFAVEGCVCGYAECAHEPDYMETLVKNRDGSRRKTVVEDGRCKVGTFTPRGPATEDRYYCGHAGWD